ncbi:MAG: hypothetical protein U0232_15810 [Thermomicrobiales bacterium]
MPTRRPQHTPLTSAQLARRRPTPAAAPPPAQDHPQPRSDPPPDRRHHQPRRRGRPAGFYRVEVTLPGSRVGQRHHQTIPVEILRAADLTGLGDRPHGPGHRPPHLAVEYTPSLGNHPRPASAATLVTASPPPSSAPTSAN